MKQNRETELDEKKIRIKKKFKKNLMANEIFIHMTHNFKQPGTNSTRNNSNFNSKYNSNTNLNFVK